MKVVVAPDSFKECLQAEEVAEAMASAVLDVCPGAEVVRIGLGIHCLCRCTYVKRSGADRVMDMVGFDRAINGADFELNGDANCTT